MEERREASEVEEQELEQNEIQKKDQSRTKVIKFGIIGAAVVTIAAILILSFFMNHQSRKEMKDISEVYMDGVSKQISMDIGALLNVHLSQAQAMVSSNPASEYSDTETMKREMVYNARILGFDYLGFYKENGGFEMLLGDNVELKNPEVLHNAITSNTGESAAAWAGRERKNVVLFGVPAQYPLDDGGESIGLVVGLSAEYFIDAMRLEKDDVLVRSYIIMKDGNYVIRSSGDYQDSYFSRVEEEIDVAASDANHYLEDLKTSMERGTTFFGMLRVSGIEQYVSCSRIPNSEWFLLAVLPETNLHSIVTKYNRQNIMTQVLVLFLVIAVFSVFIILYYRISNKQIHEMEESILQTMAANQVKSEFLSNMSHDIRIPMNTIQGMTSIALLNLNKPQQLKNCLNKISLSGHHLLGLVNDILDIFKIESGMMVLNEERFSLRELMEGVVGITLPQMKEKDQNFEIHIADVPVEYVRIDHIRFSQIMLNLMSNAIKFTPKGGKISIRMKEEDSPKGKDHIRVHIWVKDTGVGMDEEIQKKLFDFLRQEGDSRVLKIQGSGLGMAITKYIVDLMGGTIELESELYKGTEIHVSVDLLKEKNEEIESLGFSGQQILLVDDDLELCNSVVDTLNAMGLNAEWVLSGGSAIRRVVERRVKKDLYQIILLDSQLSGLTGFEMSRRLREIIGDEIPILMVTTYDWMEYEEEAKISGINGFISKPLFKSALYDGLHPFLDQKGGKDEKKETDETVVAGMRVLLAEDNELNMEVAKALLRDAGIRVEWAENGQMAVELFEEHERGYYDAILMDLRMPILDGYGAVEKIRALNREDAKKIPIIAMTADAFSEDVKKCLDAGMNAHLSKPIDMDKLMKLLEKYVEG